MPVRKQPKKVPVFTSYEMKLAELCATACWEGIDFRTNKIAEVSDQVLLNNFYVSFQRLVKSPTLPSNITEQQLRQLIRVADVKAMFRSALELDFELGIDGITNLIVPIYKASTDKKPSISRFNAGVKATKELSLSWIDNPNPSLNGNYRVPFTSRILFFCVPEMMIFNFSNPLAEKLNLQVRPQAALPYFNELMFNGLIANRALLNQLKFPDRSALSLVNWNKISKTDWWQRRVLDIAMLIKFGVSVPHRSFVNEARNQTIGSGATP